MAPQILGLGVILLWVATVATMMGTSSASSGILSGLRSFFGPIPTMTCRLLRNIAFALRQNADTLAAEHLWCGRRWEDLEQKRQELVALAQDISHKPCRCSIYEIDACKEPSKN